MASLSYYFLCVLTFAVDLFLAGDWNDLVGHSKLVIDYIGIS